MSADLEAAVCWPCVVGLHEECMDPRLTETEADDGPWVTCCCESSKDPDAHAFGTGPGRPVLDPKDLDNPVNTGRRRAQQMYPIKEGMECEWAWLAAAGGGIEPIVGCRGNTLEATKSGPHASARHHGPNKNTIENGPNNVHRICVWCHNRWHALNNRYYGPAPEDRTQDWLPIPPEGMELKRHDPDTRATDEQLDESDEFWRGRKFEKVDTED